GTISVVSPQNWWMLYSYNDFRLDLLQRTRLVFLASLGREAFETFALRGPMTTLIIANLETPKDDQPLFGIDAFSPSMLNKPELLRSSGLVELGQEELMRNPEHRITLSEVRHGTLLDSYASAYWGQGTGDMLRFYRFFWEPQILSKEWCLLQSTVENT